MPLKYAHLKLPNQVDPYLDENGRPQVALLGTSKALLEVAPAMAIATTTSDALVHLGVLLQCLARVVRVHEECFPLLRKKVLPNLSNRLSVIVDIILGAFQHVGELRAHRVDQLPLKFKQMADVAIENGRLDRDMLTLRLDDWLVIAALADGRMALIRNDAMAEAASSSDDREMASETPARPARRDGKEADEFEAVEVEPAPSAGAGAADVWGCLTVGNTCVDGLLGRYGLSEMILGAYYSKADAEKGGGSNWLLATVLGPVLRGQDGVKIGESIKLPSWMDANEAADAFGQEMAEPRLAAELEPVLMTAVAARQYVLRWGKLTAGAVTPANVVRVVDTMKPLIKLFGGDLFCTQTGPEIWGPLQAMLTKAKLSSKEPTVGDLLLLCDYVKVAVPSLGSEDIQRGSIQARMALVGKLVEGSTMLGETAKEEVKSEAPVLAISEDRTLLRGYSKQMQAKLVEKIGDVTFARVCAELMTIIEHGHAHDALRFIFTGSREFNGGEGILLGAALGWKTEVEGVPVVEKIAEVLPPYGPTFLGQIGCELVMPLDFEHEDSFPPLLKMWKKVQAASLVLDLENDLVMETEVFYNEVPAANVVRIPEEQLYTSFTRNSNLMTRICKEKSGFFACLNYHGFEAVMQEGLDYYAATKHERKDMRCAGMRGIIIGTLEERSVVVKREKTKDSPLSVYGGSIRLEHSPAKEHLERELKKAGKTVNLRSLVNRLGGASSLLPEPEFTPEDLTPPPSPVRAKVAAPGGDEDDEEKKDKDKAKEKGDAELQAKLDAIGSRKDVVKIENDTLTFAGAEKYDLKKFRATEGVPSGACAAVWLSKSNKAYHFCQHKGKEGHTSLSSGMHRVPYGWRKKNLAGLLMVAMTAAVPGAQPMTISGGSVAMRAAGGGPVGRAGQARAAGPAGLPSQAARARLPVPGEAEGASGWYGRAPAVLACAKASTLTTDASAWWHDDVSVPPSSDSSAIASRSELTKIGLAAAGETESAKTGSQGGATGRGTPRWQAGGDTAAHVLIPCAIEDDGVYLGIPPGAPGELFGSERDFEGRESDYAAAGRWSRQLFDGEATHHHFYLFELEEPPTVVSAALVDGTNGLPSAKVEWVHAAECDQDGPAARLLRIAAERADTFRMPTCGLAEDVKTGALGEQRLEARQVLVAAKAEKLEASRVKSRIDKAMGGLRAESDRRIQASTDEAQRVRMQKWQMAMKPPEISEMEPEMWDQCHRASDFRIASMRFPFVPDVHSAPLPPMPQPPPYERIPRYVKAAGRDGWRYVLRRVAYREALRTQRCTRAYWRYVGAKGTTVGAPYVPFFCCGVDSFERWAAELIREGEVLCWDPVEECITLLDQSQPPKFTLDPAYSAKLFEGSVDAGARDAFTTHGIDFLDRLAKQLVMAPPMATIAEGFGSIHESLAKMIERGWFGVELAVELDEGVLCLSTCPGRFQSVGCVPRNYCLVWRMVINNSFGDYKSLFTTVGIKAPMVSLNRSVGADGDRALRRAEAASRGEVKGKASISAQVIAGRAPYREPAKLPGSGEDGAAVLPPELKGFFFQLMQVIVIHDFMALVLGAEVYLLGDDFSKYFHLFALARRQQWACQIMTLDPAKVVEAAQLIAEEAAEAMTAAELAIIQEFCMSMGSVPSSGYGQRYGNRFCNHFQLKFHRKHQATYARWEAEKPAFGELMVRRRAMNDRSCPEDGQDMLARILDYTDDPVCSIVTEELAVDFADDWDLECSAAGLERGDPSKRTFGVCVKWVGAYALSTGLLAFLPKAKMVRAEHGLQRALRGELDEKELRELFGLLHHIVFTVVLPMHVMYNMYDGLDLLQRERAAARMLAGRMAKALVLFAGPADPDPNDGLKAAAHQAGFVLDGYDILTGQDLSKKECQAQILNKINLREWLLVWAAPLCRSYSCRHVPTLRSPQQPRGKTPIPVEWRAYLAYDTGLALFAVKAVTLADDNDLIWGLEQPSPRDDASSHAFWAIFAHVGTLWHDKAVRALAARDTAKWFDMAQCFMFSLYQKYTRILGRAEYIECLAPRFHAGEKCVCASHAKVASGVDIHGQNNSRAAAYYPPLMKHGIFEGAREACERMHLRPQAMAPPSRGKVPVTPRSAKAIKAWLEALSMRSGTTMLGSVFHTQVPRGVKRHRFHSDAALRGTKFPGISGNLYGYYYVLCILGTRLMRWPIVALEFLGEGPLNLLALGQFVGAADVIVLPCDSLVAPTGLASRFKSKIMVYLDMKLRELPVFQQLLPRLVVSHEYGVGNPISDRGSRGGLREMLEIMQMLKLRPQEVPLPPEAVKFVDGAADFFDSLSAEEREIELALLAEARKARLAARAVRKASKAVRSAVKAVAVVSLASAAGAQPIWAHTGTAAFSSAVAGDGARRPLPISTAPRLTRRPDSFSVARAHTSPAGAVTAPMWEAGVLTAGAGCAPAAPLRSPFATSGRSAPRADVPRSERPRPSPIARVRTASALPPPRSPHTPQASAVPLPAVQAVKDEGGMLGPEVWAGSLLADASPMALLPGNPGKLESMLMGMQEALERAYAASTNKKDGYHWKAWAKACALLGTPAWRVDVAANSGLDPAGHRRELILPALAMLIMYKDMQPRSKSDPAANPRSALQKLYAVAREHKKRGIKMVSFTFAIMVVKGMLHDYVAEHGSDALQPSRKNPLTHAQIDGMVSDGVEGATDGKSLTVQWSAYFWTAARATFSVLAETGMRKAEVSKETQKMPSAKGRLKFSSVRWEINGVKTAAPTKAQLDAMTEGGCWLVFGVMKNDPFNEFFGARPAWLPFAPRGRNACRALRDLELKAMAHGLTPAMRASTPLFGPSLGEEWYHSLIDRVFQFLLKAAGVKEAALPSLSVHSFRIFLACALYAAKCPNDRIMAILRWKSEEALLIYARMNDMERTEWVQKAATVTIDSTVAAHLPRVDAFDWASKMSASLDSGEMKEAAKRAETALELDQEEFEPG